ncbi:hypothetical protein Taro_032175, partial [Colocasia esculenta]|nr:hypothetical protein [Colocasia esculenta]
FLFDFLVDWLVVFEVEQVDLSLIGVDSTVTDFIFLLTGVDLSGTYLNYPPNLIVLGKVWRAGSSRADPPESHRIREDPMRSSPDAPDPFLAGGSSPMRCDPARHCRIGRDPPDTLKGCRRCAAHRDSTIIEPLYEVLRVVDGDRRPSIGLVYAKLEAARKKIREVSPRHAHLVLDVVDDRWDQQMSRDLHMAAYYLHPAYHYAHELAYDDELTAAFARMKRFREATGTFAEPSAIAGRERVDGEDPMVAWVARATTERGEYELDEEADDPEDPPRPNTFLARAVAEATAEEEGDRGNVGQPYSPRYEMDLEAEVDILADIQVEHVTRTAGRGGGNDDDDDFDRLMESLPRTQSRRRGLSTQDAPPSQSTRAPTSSQLAKGKQIATESRRKKTGATESRPSKGVVIREPPPSPAQKKRRVGFLVGDPRKARKVVLQMLVVTVVVTMEVEVVTVVRVEEEVRVVREEEVAWHSQRSNFMGVQHKIVVMVPQCGTIEGRSLDLAVKQEVHQWILIAMTL